MTRKDLLSARANDVVEAALSKGVCLGEAESTIVRKVVLAELLRVESRVFDNVMSAYQRYRESLIPQSGCEKLGRPVLTFYGWLSAQQQELGS